MKKYLKRISNFMFAIAAACVLTLAIGEEAKAASAPVTKTTTMACSVWSAPATADGNKVKSVDAGHSVTVYPDGVQSTSGNGKLFYQTTDGMYILCNCVVANETSAEYVLNINTMKFHYPNCTSVNQIKEKNKKLYSGSSDEIIAMGYAPCKICNPR